MWCRWLFARERRGSSFGRLGNKVCPDEKAHVFTFSIYRSPAREIVTRKCRPACACHADRFKSRTCRIYKCGPRSLASSFTRAFFRSPRLLFRLQRNALAPTLRRFYRRRNRALASSSSRDTNWKKVHVELDRENCAYTFEKHVSNKMRLNDCHVKN